MEYSFQKGDFESPVFQSQTIKVRIELKNKIQLSHSAGKESACNAGDTSLIPGLGRSAGERDRLPTPLFLGSPCGSAGKESAHNAGDLSLIPGWEDPLEKGKATHSSILA